MLKKLDTLLLGAGRAWAAQVKVDEVQVARLDQDLTPLGVERANNADGSISPWTSGITQASADYRPGMYHLDPFVADRLCLIVDSRNMAAYQALLTPSTQALLQANLDYHLRVFFTRRSASLPQRLYDATRVNASRAELIADDNGVQDATAGMPFPLSQSGQEAIWSHIMRYHGEQLHLQTDQAAVLANGSYNLLELDRHLYFIYGREGMIPGSPDNTLFYYKYKVVVPAYLAGSALVVQETLGQVLSIRKAWRFNRGERHVRRLSTLAYGSLRPDTNGVATVDTVDVYNGAPDYHEWALPDKREMLVPYNSYAVHQKGLAYGDILKSRFIDPDLLHYELCRVWVVEATLRKGSSYPYTKRRSYLDEDSWQTLTADIYDKDGVLTRAQEVHPINYYDVPLVSSTLEVIYDFEDGRYFVDGLDNNESIYDFGVQVGPRDFAPQALYRESSRGGRPSDDQLDAVQRVVAVQVHWRRADLQIFDAVPRDQQQVAVGLDVEMGRVQLLADAAGDPGRVVLLVREAQRQALAVGEMQIEVLDRFHAGSQRP